MIGRTLLGRETLKNMSLDGHFRNSLFADGRSCDLAVAIVG